MNANAKVVKGLEESKTESERFLFSRRRLLTYFGDSGVECEYLLPEGKIDRES